MADFAGEPLSDVILACIDQIHTIPKIGARPFELQTPVALEAAALFLSTKLPWYATAFTVVGIAAYETYSRVPEALCYLPMVGCNPLVCSTAIMSFAVDNLKPDVNPTVTTKRLAAAGGLLINYHSFWPAPYETVADVAYVRELAARKVVELGYVNPTVAVMLLAACLDMKESDPIVLNTVVRGIGILLGKYGDDVYADTRNRAVEGVRKAAEEGSATYGPWAPVSARRIYPEIAKWLSAPPVEERLMRPPTATPAPPPVVAQDVRRLQLAVNAVAPYYRLPKVDVTGSIDWKTTTTVVGLARVFTTSPLASTIYFAVVDSPTMATVYDLCHRLIIDLEKLAKQLAAMEKAAAGGRRRWWLVLPFVAVAGVAIGAVAASARKKRPA